MEEPSTKYRRRISDSIEYNSMPENELSSADEIFLMENLDRKSVKKNLDF